MGALIFPYLAIEEQKTILLILFLIQAVKTEVLPITLLLQINVGDILDKSFVSIIQCIVIFESCMTECIYIVF